MADQEIFHDYYYGDEADQYTFYRLPKALFTHSQYKNLSDSAKILYGLMLDRMGLSLKNGWLDDDNRVYIFFTLEDVQEYMNCGQDKGVKLFAELDTGKGVGLIERVKQGQGRPTKIYVKKFINIINSPVNTPEVQTSEKPKSGVAEKPKSRLRKSRSQDLGKTECSNTKSNNTDFNDTEINQSITPPQAPANDVIDRIDVYRKIIKENIDYDLMCERHGSERVDSAYEIILENVCSRNENIDIGKNTFPCEIVKRRMLMIDSLHLEYVFDCMDKNTTKVSNIKNYLTAALYNAPVTMGDYYRAAVNHDLHGGGT